MTERPTGLRRKGLPAIAAVIVIAGALLRLDQFFIQVLLDDEWHAVHQLLSGKSPAQLFLTFGHSDYSIPLGILYWLQARYLGLSELGMRWPMMVAGLLTLPLFTAWAWRRVSPAVAIAFAFALAASPFLYIYSRTARPYALTLLLSYVGIYCFERWWAAGARGKGWCLGYAACASLAVWLHPVTGPFVVAPFVCRGVAALLQRDWERFRRLVLPGFCTAGLLGLLVVPPLVADPASLAAKSGAANFGWETLAGVWFVWFGSDSTVVVLVMGMLAILGVTRLPRDEPLLLDALVGLVLTGAAIAFLQPAWSQHSVTLGRYLLPLLPLLLLAVAAGLVALADGILGIARPPWLRAVLLAGVAALPLAYAVTSPLKEFVRHPNSETNHATWQFDFQPQPNPIAAYQREKIPLSDFWSTRADEAAVTGVVAVAPFFFETHNWDAPRWEASSGLRVVPLALSGWCMDRRRGEVPRNGLYRFRNMLYLEDLPASDAPVDWVILTKPFTAYLYGDENALVGGPEYAACRDDFIAAFGEPAYEDGQLVAFRP